MSENDKLMANDRANDASREPLLGFVNASKSLLFLALAILVCVAGYLVWTNPSINLPLNQQRVQQEKAKAGIESAKSHEWTYDIYSDVDISENKYPHCGAKDRI